ncbi:hypothetical protein [Mangrovibacterium sp.]|uniref:hypothetical protein n=1 Tax=Mangrovibacterium sp. TaxID=1961364 RepID=UPI003563A613
MRKNVNVVAVLFEEVNNLLKTIDQKINDQHQKLDDVVSKEDLERNRITTENAFLQTSRNLSVLDQKLNQLSVSVQESENQIRSGLESVLSTLKDQEKERIILHARQHKLKSRKVRMAFVFLFLLFAVSLIGNVYQRIKIMLMGDNDIKYRYIKMVGGINAEELSKLEDMFHFHRNDTLIKEIQEQVKEFDGKNQEQIKELEQKHLE